jgi:hypothetical protein
MNLAGIAAAIVIFVCSNVLASRFFHRWDVTTDGLYTLSPVTQQTLEGLSESIDVVVFLSRADPLASSVRTMLDGYKNHTGQLSVRFVDPDRDPVEFIALQREYGIFEGRTDNGRLATEASIVVARGERRWYVTTDDILVFDEEDGSARPRLEAALTEAIVNVLSRDKIDYCFTLGHQELAISTGGPQGLAQYRSRLERNNYAVRQVDLAVGDPASALRDCDTMAVIGALAPFSATSALALRGHLEAGGSLLLALGPLVDEEGAISDSGLGPVLSGFGIHFDNGLIFERDDQLRMPVGYGGEVFLATPQPHAISAGLLWGESVRQRVVVQLAQALRLDDASEASSLLESSERSIRVGSFRGLQSGEFLDAPEQAAQSFVLAAALEVPAYRRPESKTPARLLVLGSPSLLWSSTWLEPSLLGTRRFVENATSWLASQPALVSVPEKQSQPAGLFLTEASLGEVQRYVLLYIPLVVVLLGVFVALRRRRDPYAQLDEQQSPPDSARKKFTEEDK